MKSTLQGAAAAALLLSLSSGAGAIQVFADFDGDQAWDASVDATPGAALTAGIYVSQSPTELAANGGLTGFELVVEAQGGLRLLGSGADKATNIAIDALWDGFPAASFLGGERVQVGGSVLVNFPSIEAVVHLFDVTLTAPAALGTYPLVLADAAGPGFTAGFATYDATATFRDTQVNVVPLPASVWMLGAALLGLFSRWRRQRA